MRLKSFEQVIRYIFSMSFMLVYSAPDLDGGGSGAQAWWEAPCVDTKCLGRG